MRYTKLECRTRFVRSVRKTSSVTGRHRKIPGADRVSGVRLSLDPDRQHQDTHKDRHCLPNYGKSGRYARPPDEGTSVYTLSAYSLSAADGSLQETAGDCGVHSAQSPGRRLHRRNRNTAMCNVCRQLRRPQEEYALLRSRPRKRIALRLYGGTSTLLSFGYPPADIFYG